MYIDIYRSKSCKENIKMRNCNLNKTDAGLVIKLTNMYKITRQLEKHRLNFEETFKLTICVKGSLPLSHDNYQHSYPGYFHQLTSMYSKSSPRYPSKKFL